MAKTRQELTDHSQLEQNSQAVPGKKEGTLVVKTLHIQRPLPPEAKEEIRLDAEWARAHRDSVSE